MRLNTTDVRYKTTVQNLRRNTDAVVDERLELVEMLIGCSNDAIIITEGRPVDFPGPKILYVNEAFTTMTGYTHEEVMGLTPRILRGPHTDRAKLDEIRQAMENWQEIWMELVNRRKDGTEYVAECHIFPCGDQQEDGSFSFWAAIQRDATAQRQLEEERDQLQQQLWESEKLRAIGTLAGGVAHDFNNILTIIVGNLAMLDKRLSVELKKYSAPISEAAQRAQSLTTQLLAVGRKSYTKNSVFSINDVLRTVEVIVRQSMPPGFNIQLELDPEMELIQGDEGLMQSVILNLCLNARDALQSRIQQEPGHVSVLRMQSYRTEKPATGDEKNPLRLVGFEVADNGIGISEAVRPHIFEPFYTTKQGAQRGSGLGLSTAYGIVSQHKGEIRVESEEGQGTSFIVEIPAFQGVQVQKTRAMRPAHVNGEHSGRILVVDDERQVARILQLELMEEGYHVEIAGNGVEALESLARATLPFDLVFLDILMPKMSGDKAIALMKISYPDVLVVIMSGYSEIDHEQKILSLGASAVLRKPFTGSEVVEAARQILAVPTV